MKQLLYVDCCIRGELSRTRRLAEAFLAAVQARGEYEIDRLVLMDEPIRPFYGGFFEQRERLLASGKLDHPRFRYAHAFAAADRIVIAAPFWDLSFPALLKTYIEQLCVEGVTFGCNETGCYGTCRAEKLCYLTTRGGDFSASPLEMGARYLEAMCAFFGIPDFCCIAADALDLGLEPPETILARAVARAREYAETF